MGRHFCHKEYDPTEIVRLFLNCIIYLMPPDSEVIQELWSGDILWQTDGWTNIWRTWAKNNMSLLLYERHNRPLSQSIYNRWQGRRWI